MKKCFINGFGCVSSQETLGDGFLDEIIQYTETTEVPALKPNYKDYIPPVAIRRMGVAVKNGIVASTHAMKEASIDELDGIIVGTGIGCAKDSEKFLGTMIQNDEEYLTPTPFIQSTHNTIAGQIALGLQSKVYNFTYVHAGNSFQSALLDGLLQVQFEEKNNFLIGGVEEIGPFTQNLFRMIEFYKKADEGNYDIFNPKTPGYVQGEGAAFLVLSNQKQESTYAEVVDVELVNSLQNSSIEKFTKDFLEKHQVSPNDIDIVLMGNNGNVKFDHLYNELLDILPSSVIPLYYKHLFGDFNSSPAVATWIAANILKRQEIPETLIKPGSNITKKESLRNVLIFSQNLGKDFSLILLRNV